MIGQSISHYRITGKLGEGGMGAVYRATDSKLGREVALKVLPEAFAKDADRMARFQREAQVLASLNHPNIAAIYGLEESGGVRALAMELVEGETLAERIAAVALVYDRRPGQAPALTKPAARPAALQLDDALSIAKQIAEALEAAHERGIIHRDLKPANIKITPNGTVKLLDFGLAKALDVAGAAASPPSEGAAMGTSPLQNSPTLSVAATQAGMILGTAAYMSPEQARGKPVDRRADIWAFGCVLYEMLTGRQTFEGETVTDTLAAVVRAEPNWDALPPTIPGVIQRLLRRALNKDPRQRLRDIGEARIAIEEVLSGNVGAIHESPLQPAAVGTPPLQGWRRALPWALTAILAVALVALIFGNVLRAPQPPTRPVARLAVTLLPTDKLAGGPLAHIALAPDGSRLVYVANHSGATQLYLRSIDRFDATAITGTEGAEDPFFSPDGLSVGFFAESKLKKVALSGGAPFALASAPENRGGSWGLDDTIIFTPSANLGLFRVSAAGGTPKALTVPDRKKSEYGHRWPEILPGGKAVLFTIWTGASFDRGKIGVLSLETGEQRVLVEGGAYARYLPSGHLVYARAGGLLAVPFDVRRLEVTGPSASVLDGVSMNPTFGSAEFSSSSDGSLAYVPGGSSVVERTLLWVDRKGAPQPLTATARGYQYPRLSPDGHRLAVGLQGANAGVWLYDLARGTLTRLTETAGAIPLPIWTVDGKRVTFRSMASGSFNIYWMAADGSGAAERLTTSENTQFTGSWSPDGQVLAFSEIDPTTDYDIKLLRLSGDRQVQPFLQTPFNESAPMFSPDGRWLAYGSDESGRKEIYVRPFPGPGGRLQISTEGGSEPVWARNGRELFYRNGDKMMAVAVGTTPEFSASKPKVLFAGQYDTGIFGAEPNYDVSPDGQRFLMIKASEQGTAATQINVVLNWSDELRRLAPAGKP